MQTELAIDTPGPGLVDVTAPLRRAVGATGIATGLAHLFIRHTSASLVIQANADPDVLADLEDFFRRLVSRDPAHYRHTVEGPDDMPAHIRAALTQTALTVPIRDGMPALGTWQGVYVWEHRDAPQRRHLVCTCWAV